MVQILFEQMDIIIFVYDIQYYSILWKILYKFYYKKL